MPCAIGTEKIGFFLLTDQREMVLRDQAKLHDNVVSECAWRGREVSTKEELTLNRHH